MVLVAEYLVTIDPSVLSSLHPQLSLFLILSSLPSPCHPLVVLSYFFFPTIILNGKPLLFFLSILFLVSPLCSIPSSFCFFRLFSFFHFHLLYFSIFVFILLKSFPYFFLFSFALGPQTTIRVFLHPPSLFLFIVSLLFHLSLSFSLYLSLSLSLNCPLIFMRLAGQPYSASLSLSEVEEAAWCQQLMDFWKTQTAMHHSPEN